MKKKVFQLLFDSKKSFDSAWFFSVFIILLIILSVFTIVVHSISSIREDYSYELIIAAIFINIVFTIEYVLRVWTSVLIPHYKNKKNGRLRFILSPMALIDLLSISPFLLAFTGVDFRMLRMLRVFRIIRLLRIKRYQNALSLITNVLHRKREEMLVAIGLTVFILLIVSTLIYYVENPVQPDKFTSIPESMWWAVITLTTVGYGDIYPITPLGQVLGGITSVIGIGIFALPTGILAAGFSEEMTRRKSEKGYCPTCGQPVNKAHHHPNDANSN